MRVTALSESANHWSAKVDRYYRKRAKFRLDDFKGFDARVFVMAEENFCAVGNTSN